MTVFKRKAVSETRRNAPSGTTASLRGYRGRSRRTGKDAQFFFDGGLGKNFLLGYFIIFQLMTARGSWVLNIYFSCFLNKEVGSGFNPPSRFTTARNSVESVPSVARARDPFRDRSARGEIAKSGGTCINSSRSGLHTEMGV